MCGFFFTSTLLEACCSLRPWEFTKRTGTVKISCYVFNYNHDFNSPVRAQKAFPETQWSWKCMCSSEDVHIGIDFNQKNQKLKKSKRCGKHSLVRNIRIQSTCYVLNYSPWSKLCIPMHMTLILQSLSQPQTSEDHSRAIKRPKLGKEKEVNILSLTYRYQNSPLYIITLVRSICKITVILWCACWIPVEHLPFVK